MAIGPIPWRGPGATAPTCPCLPARCRCAATAQTRKRWRYVGFFGEDADALRGARRGRAARPVLLGDLGPRAGSPARPHALRPGSREVSMDGPRSEIDSPGLRASLRLGESPRSNRSARAAPAGAGPASAPACRSSGHGRDPRTALGDHGPRRRRRIGRLPARHTSWHWSAGVGTRRRRPRARLEPGRGHQRPAPSSSERGIWVDGEPAEPAPVSFHGLEAVEFADGPPPRLPSGVRACPRRQLPPLPLQLPPPLRQLPGSLDGLELAEGRGVMEEHDAVW